MGRGGSRGLCFFSFRFSFSFCFFVFFFKDVTGVEAARVHFREIHEVSPSLELTSMISSTPAVTAVVSLVALVMLASAANRCLRRSIRMETCGME